MRRSAALPHMESMSTSTEQYQNRCWAVAVGTVLLIAASSGQAHDLPAREANREIVRLQGYREKLPSGVKAQREVVLSIFGEEHKFYLTDWRRFRLTDEKPPEETDRMRFDLQAKRAVLAKIAGARPDQLVTILGERRTTGSDIFILALDLCPPE